MCQITMVQVCITVDMITGKPWVDFLNEPHLWNVSYTLMHILLEIQVFNTVTFDKYHKRLYDLSRKICSVYY